MEALMLNNIDNFFKWLVLKAFIINELSNTTSFLLQI